MDGICAIDLDSILPCYFISRLRRIPRLYDAHELFCEMQEVVTRPFVYKIWKAVERYTVPAFRHGYTVNQPIAAEFRRLYGVEYAVIRNLPVMEEPAAAAVGPAAAVGRRVILYQGAVNEGRCFETLIPAMQQVDAQLLVCGEGNYLAKARELVTRYGLEKKIIFRGYVRPEELKAITRSAWCGVTLFDRRGLSNYYSLANRFYACGHPSIGDELPCLPGNKQLSSNCCSNRRAGCPGSCGCPE
jgi:glycosyltransferase involved in cell wall biosynthesis